MYSKTGPGRLAFAGVVCALVLMALFGWCARRWGSRYALTVEASGGDVGAKEN